MNNVWTLIAVSSCVAAVMLRWPAERGAARLREAEPWRLPTWAQARPGSASLRRRLLGGGAAAVACFALLGGGAAGAVVGLIVGAGVVVGLRFLHAGQEARRRERLALQLPAALDLLGAALAAGAPIGAATRTVAAVAPPDARAELDLIVARTAIGDSDADAWRQSRDRAVIGPVARDVARAAASGTALVACLRRHAEATRRERRATLENRAKAVGVRGVLPMAVCFLPAFVAVGVVPIVAGIALNLLGR